MTIREGHSIQPPSRITPPFTTASFDQEAGQFFVTFWLLAAYG